MGFIESYIAARNMSANEEIADMLAQNTVSMDKYNKVVIAYNCDTANFIAQRDEALEIFKENQDILPFTPDEARARMRAKGYEAEEAERSKMKQN